MSWFNEVTGTSDYERQSWRDSYNGGRAAGDWTGNTNARLEAERDAFQGATWSGSSSQPSALQLAQSMVGPGVSGRSTGPAASSGGGVGSATVQTVGATATSVPGVGRGSLATGGAKGPLKAALKDEITGIMIGGGWYQPNPWFSDGEAWEQRAAEPGEWLGGVTVIAADAAFNVGRFMDWGFDTDIVSNKRRDKPSAMDGWITGPGHLTEITEAFRRQFSGTTGGEVRDWWMGTVHGDWTAGPGGRYGPAGTAGGGF